jgi:hypothetical protein
MLRHAFFECITQITLVVAPLWNNIGGVTDRKTCWFDMLPHGLKYGKVKTNTWNDACFSMFITTVIVIATVPIFKFIHRRYFFRVVCKIMKRKYLLLHVCVSVRMDQLGSHWKESYEIWHSIIFRKSFEKIDVWWKYDTNKGYFTLKLRTVMIILLRMRNISKKL